MSGKTMGQIAYEAHRGDAGHRPTWDGLTPFTQRKWEVAANAVISKTGEVLAAYKRMAGEAVCSRCGRGPDEKCPEDGPGLRINTSLCPRKRRQTGRTSDTNEPILGAEAG